MAQHDYVLDNQSGAEFRQDLNNALSAIVSQNSGPVAPTTTYAYMLWADTSSSQLKQRNAANTDWVVLQELDGTLLMENGSASFPGLAFASDKDTGFYRLAANKLGISTGGSSRIVVDDQGQVLFGTTTGTWSSRAVFFGDTTFGTGPSTVTLALGSANPTDDTIIGLLNFSDSAGYDGASIRAVADANWGAYTPTRIEFRVSSASAGVGEVMRIDSEGRLGLGTDAPGYRLDVKSPGTQTFINGQNSSGSSIFKVAQEASGSSAITLTNAFASDSVKLNSFGNSWILGNLGLGTSTVSSILHINAGAAADTNVRLQTGAAGNHAKHTYSDSTNTVQWTSGYRSSTNTFGINVGDGFNSTGLTIDNQGRVAIGTTSPGGALDVAVGGLVDGDGAANMLRLTKSAFTAGSQIATMMRLRSGTGTQGTLALGLYTDAGGVVGSFIDQANGSGGIQFRNGGSNTVRIDSSGRVGIGTTSPSTRLHVVGTDNETLRIDTASTYNTGINWYNNGVIKWATQALGDGTNAYRFYNFTTNSEALRIDSSGRLLVGTSSTSGTTRAVFAGSTFSPTSLSIVQFARGSANPVTHDDLARLEFTDSNAAIGARIEASADGNWGTYYPSRLVFYTTSSTGTAPTERMRITSSNFVNIGTQGTDVIWNQTSVKGVTLGAAGVIQAARDADQLMLLNRIANDGVLVTFAQDGVAEGNISVSGTTVSYNGAHLSRWSQLPGGAAREEILRGTVLSNIDEMCAWGKEENEQLNRMKVSDVAGDPNVAGVFQAWDDDDDTYTDDFYCAMTGDFIIRIAQGVTVQRGDLLMSAGDGTAIPQDDDIVRSKTVAKVTSNHITCTYDDGSYCVPCVLMAC